jgi:hypothetical protein
MRKIWLAGAGALLLVCLTGCTRQGGAEMRTYPLGTRVQAGSLLYTVFDTQWFTQLGDGLDARIPEHRFFLIRLSVVNSGGKELMVPPFTLLDEDGNTHSELTNGEKIPMWTGLLRSVRQGETLQGNVAFDVPPRHYKLKISDETEQKSAWIEIPLAFGPETPDLPPADRR